MAHQTPYRRGGKPTTAGALIDRALRRPMEKRGFAEARVLTDWDRIVGADLAALTRPVKVGYARGGMTGTLTLLVRGADAPVVDMRREEIRARVNAAYGYNAIGRVVLTQTAAALPRAEVPYTPPAPTPEAAARARSLAQDVADPGLRAALERLGGAVLSKPQQR